MNVESKHNFSRLVSKLRTIMTKEELIRRAYDVFSPCKKPKQCTKYTDLEDAEFNAMLLSTSRRTLTIEQAGTVSWSPIPSMTPEALAYFMPRLIELAVTNAIDSDGDPFFCHFIDAFSGGPQDERFKTFERKHRAVMADTFGVLVDNYHDELVVEGRLDEARRAIGDWSKS